MFENFCQTGSSFNITILFTASENFNTFSSSSYFSYLAIFPTAKLDDMSLLRRISAFLCSYPENTI